jgi:hypothetical protein
VSSGLINTIENKKILEIDISKASTHALSKTNSDIL